MADVQTHTLGTDGFVSKSQVGDFTLDIDALGDGGATPNRMLVVDYASCVLPAFRVGGQQTGRCLPVRRRAPLLTRAAAAEKRPYRRYIR